MKEGQASRTPVVERGDEILFEARQCQDGLLAVPVCFIAAIFVEIGSAVFY